MGKDWRVNQEIILSEVDHDNGRMINSGPREPGTHKKDKIGVQHKDGPLVRHIEILGLNLSGEISRLPVNVIKTGVNNHNLHKVGGKIHSRVINSNSKLLQHSIGLRSSNNNHNSNNSCRLYRRLSIHLGYNQQMYNLLQVWDTLVPNKHGQELGQPPRGSSHHLDPNQHRDQL